MNYIKNVLFAVFCLSAFSSSVVLADNDAEMVLPKVAGLHSSFGFTLGPTALSSFSLFADSADEEAEDALAAMLDQVDKVKFKLFSASSESGVELMSRFDRSFMLLNSYSWQKVASVNRDSKYMLAYAKYDEERVRGITFLVLEDQEAFLVNISGDISPEVFARFIASTQ